MSAITYDIARVPAAKSAARDQASGLRKNLFVRAMDALAESRLQQAHREIVKHAHLLGSERGSLIGDR